MGSYTDVKNLIISNIKANGQREITGPILQDVLLNMLENSSRVEEITYSDLKALRDGAKLTPSRLYRITDYITTTVQSNTKSAGHPFDVIVLALSESELLEQAWAIQHGGDEYFANSNLSDWELWYCLDNDTTRFAWADSTNGKGVIYRMIDEFNNDCPYDFKNIQFYRKWHSSNSLWSTISFDNTGVPCYTFSSEGSSSTTSFTDMSLDVSNEVYSNVIKEYMSSNKQTLNNNCFFGINCGSNTFGNNCRYNSFGGGCLFNSFGLNCAENTVGNNCSSNTFGDNCRLNTFIHACKDNSFGSSCTKNTLGDSCYSNSFGDRCSFNSFGDSCYSNSFGDRCSSNSFGGSCFYNSFGQDCYNNSFRVSCSSNSLGDDCDSNSFGGSCSGNTFGNDCDSNSFGGRCDGNTFGYYCNSNSFGDMCAYNTFGNGCGGNSLGSSCLANTFGNDCEANSFGSFYKYNSFGNGCYCNSFRVSSSTTSSLKNYVYYNHLDDGCSYNVIWNSKTTSSSTLLKNVNVNRGVVGTSSSYNMINIDVLNSEQEINVNQIDGVITISNISDISNKLDNKLDKIIELSYSELVTLRSNGQLIPGQQYRIIDYITTTTQENTKSAWHQFDIIVTALDESTLSEEAQAIQNSNDGYFDDSNLSAWKIWYCLDNDTNRFAWAGDTVKVDEIEHKSYDSSKCTIKTELIDGNAFITPFNFESCVWVDGNNDGATGYGDDPNHDIDELIYEWGYFTDEKGVNQLCIYKSDAGYYEEDGHPDYGDKYLYRGVVNVDGAEYDYWQKWDDSDNGIYINGDDYVYATTQSIVSNPEAYSATIETEDVYGQGKGVIYRMIDEWNNDVPYDFKNIQYNGSWGYWAYTFNWINDNSDNTCEDLSVAQYAHANDEGSYSHTYGNVIKPCEDGSTGEYGYPLKLNNIVFLNTESYDSGMYSGCASNIFGNNCYDNTFGNDCNYNTFGDRCSSNTVGDGGFSNSFGPDCDGNIFGNYCNYITFINTCSDNSFGERCSANTLDSNCYNNTFGNEFSYNTFGKDCIENTFGDAYYYNTFGNNCQYIKFASDSSSTAKYSYYRNNHFGDGCQYILFKGIETASYYAQIQNYNFAQGLHGTYSSYLTINGVRNLSYEAKVAKNSKDEIKIYCEADLIA